MSNEIPMLSIIKKGSSQYPRFVLAKADEYGNPLYWNGLTWSSDEADAILYSDVTQAHWAYHDILTDAVSDRPCHRFIAPVYIEIFGDKPNLADLRKWLEKAVRIVVDSPKHGLGPSDTVGVIILDAERTKSV